MSAWCCVASERSSYGGTLGTLDSNSTNLAVNLTEHCALRKGRGGERAALINLISVSFRAHEDYK